MQTALKPAASIWEATSPKLHSCSTLQTSLKSEITIIGGGLTGLSAALYLARNGHQVTVLEGRTIGFGGSGRNNGQVIPVLSAAEPDKIEQIHGDIGTRFVDLLQNSAGTLFDLIKTEGISCEAQQNGWLQPAHSAAHMHLSQSRVAAWEKRGAPATLLDQSHASKLIGSTRWFGGMFNPTGGHINPLMFARGLAEICTQAGVQIYENTPALKVSRACQNWLIKTPKSTVISQAVLLATNAYTGALAHDLAPVIRRSFIPITSWQMATQPLTPDQNASILPSNIAISDTRGDLHFFRKNCENRLITGSALMFKTAAHPRLRRRISKRLRDTFPQFPAPKFSHIWGGYVGITTDFFPRFHQLGPNYIGYTGYNGRGLALTIPLGIELAKALLGSPQSGLAIPLSAPRPLPFHAIAKRVAPVALAKYRYRDTRPPHL